MTYETQVTHAHLSTGPLKRVALSSAAGAQYYSSLSRINIGSASDGTDTRLIIMNRNPIFNLLNLRSCRKWNLIAIEIYRKWRICSEIHNPNTPHNQRLSDYTNAGQWRYIYMIQGNTVMRARNSHGKESKEASWARTDDIKLRAGLLKLCMYYTGERKYELKWMRSGDTPRHPSDISLKFTPGKKKNGT